MVSFKSVIQKYEKNKEKSGWVYLEIPISIANKINPGVRKAYRVKGKIDNLPIKGVGLTPIGEGNFILTLNAEIRKALNKPIGSIVDVSITIDKAVKQLAPELVDCLGDFPSANSFFKTLTPSHQHYFSDWIKSAKTDCTKAKRIEQTIEGLSRKMGYPETIRFFKEKK